MKWFVVVILLSVSLMIINVEHFSMCFWTIVYTFGMSACSFCSFHHFNCCVVIKVSELLHLLDVSLLSDIWCLCIFLLVCLFIPYLFFKVRPLLFSGSPCKWSQQLGCSGTQAPCPWTSFLWLPWHEQRARMEAEQHYKGYVKLVWHTTSPYFLMIRIASLKYSHFKF